MPEQAESKGMSKGCVIGLIVLSVVTVLIVVAGVTCYWKRHEIFKFGVATLVGGIKQELATKPVGGVDTVAVDRMADAFVKKLNESEIDGPKIAALAQSLQAIMADRKVDSAEATQFIEAMVKFYPELREPAPGQPQPADSGAMGK